MPLPRRLGAVDVRIRPEEREDFAAIAAVVTDAFGPDHGPVVVTLVEGIRASAHYVPDLALVAEDVSGIVGHVMLSWVGVETAARDRLLNLSPMSVRSDRQRLGVGTRLIERALSLAQAAGEPAVIVEGVPAYYPRFGFERASALGFLPPHDDIPDAAFMVRRLPTYDPAIAGRVVYPAAFEAVRP
jgi:putative acetyltransferase